HPHPRIKKQYRRIDPRVNRRIFPAIHARINSPILLLDSRMGMNALAMSDAASAQRRAEAALPAARRKGRPLLAIGLSALTGAAVIAATWYYRNTIPLWPLIAGTG